MFKRHLLPAIFFIFLLVFGKTLSAQSPGSIQGTLLEADTHAPLPGANVTVLHTVWGAAADMDGNFVIPSVPVGSYTLQFSFIGYENVIRTDVIVRPKRITRVDAVLQPLALKMDSVVVTSGYFATAQDAATSAIQFSFEEIRRAPGSAGDVSRILMSLPAIAKMDDQTNHLVVRGGSPVENAFFIDNIEIPNINHFPTAGSSGGALGILNVDLIQSVTFHAGGFSAAYGDRLSSVMDLQFRAGNREAVDTQLDLNFAGFGGVAEGPLGRRGSWLVSARRSYLDWLIKAVDVGSTLAPRYGDLQAKVVVDATPNHQFSFIEIMSDDHNHPDRQQAIDNKMIYFADQDILENTAGINWRALWPNGYSNTSLAHTASYYKEDFFETGSGLRLIKNHCLEQTVKLRNLNHFRLTPRHSLEFGFDAKFFDFDYDNAFAPYTDALGAAVTELKIDQRIRTGSAGGFLNFTTQPLPRLTATLGLRADYFAYNAKATFAPRLSVSYAISNRTTLNGAIGRYDQNLPLRLLSQQPENRDLSTPRAMHYILGLAHLLTENTRLTLEIYRKDYNHFPQDPAQPELFLLDELYYRYGFFFNHNALKAAGKAQSQGVELLVQKKLARNFYGLVSGAYFETRYQGGDGIWRNRVFDNRFLFSLEGGYKPNFRWEFSARWIFAGGRPCTPFDESASRALNRAVLDESQINAARYPAYHSMNLRCDRRFHFANSNLILYFSVWNAYNHRNVAAYFWNQAENKPDAIYQWSLLPIFGFEFEF